MLFAGLESINGMLDTDEVSELKQEIEQLNLVKDIKQDMYMLKTITETIDNIVLISDNVDAYGITPSLEALLGNLEVSVESLYAKFKEASLRTKQLFGSIWNKIKKWTKQFLQIFQSKLTKLKRLAVAENLRSNTVAMSYSFMTVSPRFKSFITWTDKVMKEILTGKLITSTVYNKLGDNIVINDKNDKILIFKVDSTPTKIEVTTPSKESKANDAKFSNTIGNMLAEAAYIYDKMNAFSDMADHINSNISSSIDSTTSSTDSDGNIQTSETTTTDTSLAHKQNMMKTDLLYNIAELFGFYSSSLIKYNFNTVKAGLKQVKKTK